MNRCRHQLKMSSFINSSLLYEDIEDFYLQKKKYPHCLILLSSKEYSNLKQNSAHVTDINCTNKKWIKYKNIAYIGSNLYFMCAMETRDCIVI